MDVKKIPLISFNSNEQFYDLRKIFNFNINLPLIIAGPCGVEDYEGLDKTAKFLSKYDIKFLRAGLYKPRSSPYSFQGLRQDGLSIVKEISEKYKMIIVSEIVDTREIEFVSDYIDVFQIGSRNMQNFELLKEVGRLNKPVILKRGMCSTLDEFI